MAGLRAIVNQMADQIRAGLDGVTGLDIQVEPRPVLSPTPLTIDMVPGAPFRDLPSAAFGDDGGYLFTVRAYINTPEFDDAYDVLIALMDDEDDLCLAHTLLDEPTLNGNAHDLDIRDASGLILIQTVSGDSYLGFQFAVLVLPAKS